MNENTLYLDVIKNREYYNKNTNNVKEILKVYQNNIDKFQYLNKLVDTPKDPRNIRIATWNVRYFTDYNDNPTIKGIAGVISKISPDILCL